jgi:hypothetical protein
MAWYHDVETLSVCLSDNRAMTGLITELPEAVINNEPAGQPLALLLNAILVVSVYAFTAKTGPVLLDNRAVTASSATSNLISAEEPGLVCQPLTMDKRMACFTSLRSNSLVRTMRGLTWPLSTFPLENAADGSCLFERFWASVLSQRRNPSDQP